MAEGEVPAEASGTETTENQAAAQSLGEEAVPETEVTTEENGIAAQAAELTKEPVQEETEQEITEVPAENTETPAETTEPVQEETGEPAETTETDQTIVQSTEAQEDPAVAEETPVEEQPAETTEETVTEETVVSEAAELKQEFTDENGNVTQTVTAYVPEGAFQATADQISMEVSLLNTDDTNYIKGMMEELLPENHYLDGYVLYQIDFKVNGEITQPEKAVTITMNGNDLAVEDTQKAHVFYYDAADPEVEGDKDQLIEVTQKDQLIKSLEESGQSTENIQEQDYSEITVNEGNADTITVKGWKSTIYGCYVEKEAVTELTYEDDSVTVTVSTDQAGIIPDGAELSVTPITKTEITDNMSEEEKAQAEEINAQYDFTEEQLQKDSEENATTMEGFLAYDICFLVDGEEIEPSGDVKVVMDFKEAAVPEGVSEDAEVEVKHLKEDESAEDGVVVEDMGEKSTTDTTDKVEVERVEFVAENFSIYTITWRSDRLTIKIVDSEGNYLGENQEYSARSFDWQNENTITVQTILADIRDKCDAVENMKFNKAVYTENGKFDFGADEINSFKYKSTQGIYEFRYNPVGNSESWRTVEENAIIYFIFGDDPETQWPETVDTVSTKDEGIKINLFDYQVGENGNESVDLSNSDDDGLNQGINKGHILKFVSSKGSNNQNINIWQNGSSGYLNKFMVLPNLGSDGYPILSEEYHSQKHNNNSGTDSESLNYLFNTNDIPGIKNVYENLDNLFQKDGDGYYTYSSDSYYVYLNELSDDATFTGYQYEQQGKGFYPFTDPIYGESTLKSANDNAVLGSRDVNHYFGMTISAGFIQPYGGQIQGENNTSSPMEFEFSGDDDVWVFIDDVLVLDLGGIHGAVSGKIDFSNGNVYVKDINAPSYVQDGTILSKFQEAGKASDVEFSGNTFANYSSHTIKFFYLERGNAASNCTIKFNFPTIPENSVSVAKEVVNKEGMTVDYAEDIDFHFNIKRKVDGENLVNYANQKYTIYQGSSSIGTDTTDKYGNFTLKHDQMAVFEGFSATDQWQVTETGAYLNGYEVEYNGEHIEVEGTSGSETIYSATTPILSAGTQSSLIFKNTVRDTTKIQIAKEVTGFSDTNGLEFQIKVLFQGEEYVGSYHLSGETSPKRTEDGIIRLKAGETAEINGLPYGTSFEVYEMLDGSYQPEYQVNGTGLYNITVPTDNNEAYSVSGNITGDGGTVTVTNTKIDLDPGTTSVTVTKDWEGIVTNDLKPPYITVTLYKDVNMNGILDEAVDTPVLGQDGRPLTAQLTADGWTKTWSGLEPDTDYVVKEEYPPEYQFVSSSSSNTITRLELQGDKNSPNSTTKFELKGNSLLLVKQTGSAGGGYFLWSPIDLKLSEEEISSIKTKILTSGISGAGNLSGSQLTYQWGTSGFQGISLAESENGEGWILSFDATSTWSLFWRFVYDRTQAITITNTLDTTYKISVDVEKKWINDDPENRPANVTVQLYKNNEPCEDEIIVLDENNKWKGSFDNLFYYSSNDSGGYIKNQYTVKEIKIGDTEVDANGQAAGYQSSVEGNADDGFIIKNSLNSKWEIVKKSSSKDPNTGTNLDVPAGAEFTLTRNETTSTGDKLIYYGKVEENSAGKIIWYDANKNVISNEGIEAGTYTLVETKAPVGYSINAEEWTLVFASKGTLPEVKKGDTPYSVEGIKDDSTGIMTYTYVFEDEALYELPSAGGPGIFLYMIGGTLLLIAGSLMIYINRRRGVLRR